MIAAVVRWVAIFASVFVALGFFFFAVNQTSNASKNQVSAIEGGSGVKAENATKVPNPSPAVERLREQENDTFHEYVDDINDVLLAPFTGIVNSNNIWVIRLVPAALALLLYGLGGLYLARVLGLKRW